jgi:hypothetical protein
VAGGVRHHNVVGTGFSVDRDIDSIVRQFVAEHRLTTRFV